MNFVKYVVSMFTISAFSFILCKYNHFCSAIIEHLSVIFLYILQINKPVKPTKPYISTKKISNEYKSTNEGLVCEFVIFFCIQRLNIVNEMELSKTKKTKDILF